MTTEKQRNTFLSYSRLNKDFAVKLAKELKSEGFNVWLDTLDIPLGSRWDREVERALKESEIFMIILTPDSVDSENVLDEIGYAIDTHKRILPILLEDCEVPLRLRRLQYVDFTRKSFEEGVEAAKALLRGLIEQPTGPHGAAVVNRQAQADADRLAKQKAEEELAVRGKTEKERKEKEEAERTATQKAAEERLAKQKTDDERIAKAKADKERKATEEADRLMAQKAEEERLVRAKVEADRKAKEDADRKAKEELDRKAKEEAERKRKPEKRMEPVPSSTSQKKTLSGGLVAGIITIVVLCVAGIGLTINVFSNGDTRGTNAPGISPSATKPNSSNTPRPTNTQKPTNTPRPSSTPLPARPSLLNSEDVLAVLDSGEGISLVSLAQEQLGGDEFSALIDNSEQIPVVLDSSGPTLSSPGGWCSLNADILQENLDHIAFWFDFNDVPVPDKNILYNDFTSDDGWECLQWYIAIDDWTTGIYHLAYGYSIDQSINDGENDYKPGYVVALYFEVTVP